jgi:chemotaxis protein CheX
MPAPLVELTDALIEQAINKGVSEVVDTMGNSKVDCLGRTPNPPLHSRPRDISGAHTVASVGFVGDLNGIINTHFDDQLAIDLSARMLGMTPAEVTESEVLSDATGEMTNMIVGVFKNMLCDLGYVCKLTLPSIIRGSDFHVDHGLKSARRFIVNFRCRDRAIVTDIIIQQD